MLVAKDASTSTADKSESASHSTATRLQALDAYRGAIMISLAFGGFGLAETASRQLQAHGSSQLWSTIAFQFEHVPWVGCTYWDLIQPSFMFMVGVSMAYSYLKRERLGHSYLQMLGHAIIRSVILILLGVFLSSNGSPTTNWSFMNVLSQIGLGYTFLFLLWRRGLAIQLIAALGLLIATWLLYANYSQAGIDLEQGNPQVGVTAQWAQQHLAEVAPAWHKNANIGHAIDLTFLNWFPRSEPFEFNSGGYQTLNFVPSLATMIFGLICGQWLKSSMTDARKFWSIVGLGVVCLFSGWALAEFQLIPLVKRIWTPSWALYSTGWCCFILAGLYAVIDIMERRTWAFPLVVVGTNSIAVYLMSQMLKPWVGRSLQTHFGQQFFLAFGEVWEPFLRSTLIGIVFWLVCLWLYRQRIFLRI